MLFDLRSRGRRRTVQGVYLGLAILMGGGLVLFGVGAGNGFGGILNAFTGNGSSGAGQQIVSQAEKTAEQQTKLHPNDPQAWAALIQAHWDAAKGTDYNAATGTFTAAGNTELANTVAAWQRYRALTSSPDPLLATIAARAYGFLGQYSNQASTWEVVTSTSPSDSHAFECLAVSAYAASETRKGDLAAAKAESLLPKASQTSIKQLMQAAKLSPKTAQTYAQQC